MRINTNMAALNAWRNMTSNNSNMQKSLEKLSSGFRINRAADDAAGLAVSEKMRAQIRGTNQSIKNSQDGISLLQTAEGALTEVHSMLQRMRELSVQSSTSTLQDSDRALLQEEFSQLQSEITRIGDSTQFNGQKLLDGSSGLKAAQTVVAGDGTVANISGSGKTQAGTFTFDNLAKATAGVLYMGDATVATGATFSADTDTFTESQTITVNGKSYGVTAGSTTAKSFIEMVNADSASTGVKASYDVANVIKFETVNAGSAQEVSVRTSIAAGDQGIAATTGAVGASTTAVLTDAGTDATGTLASGTLADGTTFVGGAFTAVGDKITVVGGSADGLNFDLSAAGDNDAVVKVEKNNTLNIQTGSQAGQTLSVGISDMRSKALGVDTLSIATQAGASSAITAVDSAINSVSTQRAKLGALQNRLEYTVGSQSTTAENLSAAESRIRDVDMASEMAQFTKYQILSQASTAMLSQANQSTQGVLSLLR